jgi:hypothetical protein
VFREDAMDWGRSIVRIVPVDFMGFPFVRAGWLKMDPVMARNRRYVGLVDRV